MCLLLVFRKFSRMSLGHCPFVRWQPAAAVTYYLEKLGCFFLLPKAVPITFFFVVIGFAFSFLNQFCVRRSVQLGCIIFRFSR